jgi:ATP-dependent DNA ligase
MEVLNPIQRPTLYKRDSSGKIRTWFATTAGAIYTITSGTQGGKSTTSKPTICEPKNVGRSNETTADEQCQAEVEALYTKKLKTGYFENIEDVDSGTALFPMLAFRYDDLKKPLPFGKERIFAQPKLDGIRNIGRQDGNFSRKAEEFLTFPQVTGALRPIHEIFPNLSFDGELYSHHLQDDLPKINSVVKKKKPTAEHLEQASALQYHVYDFYNSDDPGMPFSERTEFLEELYERYLEGHPSFQLVETNPVESQDYLDFLYAKWRKEGYEGQIIRRDAPYEPAKRPQALIKRKEYIDREFEVVDILEGKGNWSGAAKTVVYRNPTIAGDTFETGLAGTYEDNVKILAEKSKYIGGEGTVAFFKFSPYGVPVQGVTKALYEGGRNV